MSNFRPQDTAACLASCPSLTPEFAQLMSSSYTNDIDDLNGTINHLDLTDIYGLLHSTTIEFTFFSRAFSKVNHMLNCQMRFSVNLEGPKSENTTNRELNPVRTQYLGNPQIFWN